MLNRTQCVVVIPPGTRRLRPGTAACRETSDQWNTPTLVTFEGKAGSKRAADLLIFLLKNASVKALRSESLEIETYRQPLAPVAPKKAIPSEHELNVELLTYEYASSGLSGRRVQGIVRQENALERAKSDKAVSHGQEKITKHYLSALTSFFNTVIPTGIVIHHTAVLPDQNAPPRNEHEVDKYHERKGFEITCFGHVYHVAYQYLILTSGRIQTGRPERCEGAHATGYNSFLGISVVGDFDSHDNPKGEKGAIKPNRNQMAALVRLCQRLMLRYHIPVSHIVRHRDIAATRCPGDRFPFLTFLRELRTNPPKAIRFPIERSHQTDRRHRSDCQQSPKLATKTARKLHQHSARSLATTLTPQTRFSKFVGQDHSRDRSEQGNPPRGFS